MRSRRTLLLLLFLVWMSALAAAFLADRRTANWAHSAALYSKNAPGAQLVKLPGTYWLAIASAVLVGLFHRRGWRAAAPVLIAGPLVGIAYTLLKWMVGRHRPNVPEPFAFHPFIRGFAGLMGAENNLSFPSGHAAMAFATATCLAVVLPRWSAIFFLVASTVAVERVLENAHYVSDVVAGAGLGICCGCVAVSLAGRLFGSAEARRPVATFTEEQIGTG